MAKDIPDYMRGFDTSDDWGMTPVSSTPKSEPSVDPKVVEDSKLEISKVKSDVSDIKSMMNEIMQIVNERESISQEITDEGVKTLAEWIGNVLQHLTLERVRITRQFIVQFFRECGSFENVHVWAKVWKNF